MFSIDNPINIIPILVSPNRIKTHTLINLKVSSLLRTTLEINGFNSTLKTKLILIRSFLYSENLKTLGREDDF